MIKKTVGLILVILASFVFFVNSVLAQESLLNVNKSDEEVSIYFFSRNGCSHCTKEEPFLERLEQKYPEVKVYKFDIAEDKEGIYLLKEFEKEFDIKVAGVPFTVVGKEHFTGWYSEETTGTKIENAVLRVGQDEQEKIEIVSPQNDFLPPNKTKATSSSLLVIDILRSINSFIILIFSL